MDIARTNRAVTYLCCFLFFYLQLINDMFYKPFKLFWVSISYCLKFVNQSLLAFKNVCILKNPVDKNYYNKKYTFNIKNTS